MHRVEVGFTYEEDVSVDSVWLDGERLADGFELDNNDAFPKSELLKHLDLWETLTEQIRDMVGELSDDDAEITYYVRFLPSFYPSGRSKLAELAQRHRLERAAKKGHVLAQKLLGDYYCNSFFERDLQKAARWYCQAEQSGMHGAADGFLRNLKFENTNATKAFACCRTLAEAENPNAQEQISHACLLGYGTPRDEAAALEWARKALE